MRQLFSSIYLTQRFLFAVITCVVLLIVGHFWPMVLWLAQGAFLLFCVAVCLEIVLLYGFPGVEVVRILPEKLSNGDEKFEIEEISENDENSTDSSIFEYEAAVFDCQTIPNPES